nr:Chain D, Anastral spindle 2 [Drosophila melanogaster]
NYSSTTGTQCDI